MTFGWNIYKSKQYSFLSKNLSIYLILHQAGPSWRSLTQLFILPLNTRLVSLRTPAYHGVQHSAPTWIIIIYVKLMFNPNGHSCLICGQWETIPLNKHPYRVISHAHSVTFPPMLFFELYDYIRELKNKTHKFPLIHQIIQVPMTLVPPLNNKV